jgi:hypothetical protein
MSLSRTARRISLPALLAVVVAAALRRGAAVGGSPSRPLTASCSLCPGRVLAR